eukprot:IDg15252t1
MLRFESHATRQSRRGAIQSPYTPSRSLEQVQCYRLRPPRPGDLRQKTPAIRLIRGQLDATQRRRLNDMCRLGKLRQFSCRQRATSATLREQALD